MSELETSQIRDIPKFKEMRQTMQFFKVARAIFPFANPLLRLLGIDTKEMKEALAKLPALQKEFEELSELPDRFNDVFSSRGWIMFEFLNIDAANEALKIAETDISKAEEFLVEYYSYEEVGRYLQMMQGIQAFRPRMQLAELALIDYKEERYHASIPIVLMLMDGLVNDLNPQNLGMSAENSNLTAWDSITAHEKGLSKLKEVLFRSRKTTRTEEIHVPYRHGILHGMDLGYANKTVAAKSWAALFAVRDWAAKVEGKQLKAPLPKPETTLDEIAQTLQEHAEWKDSFDKHLENWKPRIINFGKDFPQTGNTENYGVDTPERKIVEFLHLWKKKNYGHMARCVWSLFQRKDLAKRVRKTYGDYELKSFELVEVIDEAPSISEVIVQLKYELKDKIVANQVKFRLTINEAEDGRIRMRGMSGATWGIVNWEYGTFTVD